MPAWGNNQRTQQSRVTPWRDVLARAPSGRSGALLEGVARLWRTRPSFRKGAQGYSRQRRTRAAPNPECALPLQAPFAQSESPPDIFLVQSVRLLVDSTLLDHRLRPVLPGIRESRGQVLTAQTVILPAVEA